MIAAIQAWWHRYQDHTQRTTTVSAPMWDPGARGILVHCSCGKKWAR